MATRPYTIDIWSGALDGSAGGITVIELTLPAGNQYILRDFESDVLNSSSTPVNFAFDVAGVNVRSVFLPSYWRGPLVWHGRIATAGLSTIAITATGVTFMTFQLTGYQLTGLP